MSIEIRFRFGLENFQLDVSLDLPGRGVTSLFGPSGCGKTSLLRAIAGLDRHPGGFLRVGDLLWQDDRLLLLSGATDVSPISYRVRAGFQHRKKQSRREFVRAKIVADDRPMITGVTLPNG